VEGETAAPKTIWERRGRRVMTATAGAAIALALLAGALGAPAAATTALLVVPTIAGGWYVVRRALRAARNRALNMNFLMSVAAG